MVVVVRPTIPLSHLPNPARIHALFKSMLEDEGMPPSKLSPDIEEELRSFLSDQKQEQREGYSNKAIAQAQQKLFDSLELHKKNTAEALSEHKGRIAELGFRLGTVEGAIPELKSRLVSLEGETRELSEDSKVHRIDELTKALEDSKKKTKEIQGDRKYWVRYLIGGVIGVGFAIVTAVILNAFSSPAHIEHKTETPAVEK